MTFRQQAGPAGRQVEVGAAAGPRYVFTDMKVGQVRPLLPYVMRLRNYGIWFTGVHLYQPIFVMDGFVRESSLSGAASSLEPAR
ncbi:hypothetical protein B0G38_002286 [Arthrobacter sp. VKM Ac-2550]|nr:hypothetical protein [Arthrobacter sp. VKM Ac-2550]